MSKPVLILERYENPIAVDKKSYIMSGILTVFDEENLNKRIYTAPKFLPCLEDFQSRIKLKNGVLGELDHPDTFDTSIKRVSHTVREASYIKERNRVEGKIKVLDTVYGKDVKALINEDCPIFVSSRAAGVTNTDGTVDLKKLFAWDIVDDPGFPSARMNCINESLNYNTNANFRIYDLSEESNTNDLFNMNKNDAVTQVQISEYSEYLSKQIESMKKQLNEAIKKGSMPAEELQKLLEKQEMFVKAQSKTAGYLDYLAEKITFLIKKDQESEDKINKLIEYVDYQATISEKVTDYIEYLGPQLDDVIQYSESVAKKLHKSLVFENYLAKNLDKTIAFADHLSSKLKKSVGYTKYISEQLNKVVDFGNYLAEGLDTSILYSEGLTEHIKGNIDYSNYIANNLDANFLYNEHVAANLDKVINYSGMIAAKLNNKKINEKVEVAIPTLEDFGFENLEDDEEEIANEYPETEEPISDEIIVGDADAGMSVLDTKDDKVQKELDTIETAVRVIKTELSPVVKTTIVAETPVDDMENELENELDNEFSGDSDTELSESINALIKESTKRKLAETNDLHFLKFLNKPQVGNYYTLTNEQQEAIKVHISGKTYYSTEDVLKLINEALSVKKDNLENRVIDLMPNEIKPVWEKLSDNAKLSIMSQAKMFSDTLITESAIENFWYTRSLPKEETTKKLISHTSLIHEDVLSNDEQNYILESLKKYK
jgi:hypothetical protein